MQRATIIWESSASYVKQDQASTSLSPDTYPHGHRHFNCDVKPRNPIFNVDNIVDTCALRNGLANTVSVMQ